MLIARGILLILLCVVALAPAIPGPFFRDDRDLIADNLQLRTTTGLSSIWIGPDASAEPLAASLRWCQYRLWAARPLNYRLVSLLLHAVATILLWTLLRHLAVPGASVAAALFAAHPMQVQPIAWISCQGILLAAVFCLGSTLVFLRHVHLTEVAEDWPESDELRWGTLIVALVLLAGAVLSQPASAIQPAALAALLWWKRGRLGRRDAWRLVPFFVIGLSLFTLGLLRTPPMSTDSAEPTFVTRILAVLFVIASGAWKAICPYPLLPACLPWAGEALSPWPWFYLPLAPVLCLLVASLYALTARASCSQRIVALRLSAAGALLCLLFPLTWRQGLLCADEPALWRHVLAHEPRLALAHLHMGAIRLEQQNFAEADVHYRAVLSGDPKCGAAILGLGHCLEASGTLDEVVEHYRRAIPVARSPGPIHAALGLALARTGQYSAAIESLERAVELDPSDVHAHNELGLIYAEHAEPERALEHYGKALAARPDCIPALINLANLRFQQRQFEQAAAQLQRVIQLDPLRYEAFMNAGAMLAQLKDFAGAERMFRSALQLRPASAEAHNYLGIVIAAQGGLSEAAYNFARAADLDPRHQSALRNLEAARAQLRNEEEDGT